ncbi:adenosylcobinamide amidohydrolase [bacterium]|nr:adenosylcobinamide amidohydrolase [bacterium]
MVLEKYYDGIEIHREEKIIYAKFLSPHRVISTDRITGGLSDELEYIYNHQSCEPTGHYHGHKLAVENPAEYKRLICEQHGLSAEKCASLGTAANMNNVAISHDKFHELEVVAVCTGGVETNAGRVGDTASYYEKDGNFVHVDAMTETLQSTLLGGGVGVSRGERATENHGTINTMVFISQELIPGAMVRAVMTATEAKTAVLQELAVNSRYSDGLATGTGTDQIGIASKLGSAAPLTSAGKHTKLGELIGKTVHDAIKQTLALQNRMTPQGRCSALIHIERFGADKDFFCASVGKYLQEAEAELFNKNFLCINNDPPTVAAVAALVHLRDKFVWGTLPESCMPEILSSYGAQIAAAVSGKYNRIPYYIEKLSAERKSMDNEIFLNFVYKSFALGFSEKWL